MKQVLWVINCLWQNKHVKLCVSVFILICLHSIVHFGVTSQLIVPLPLTYYFGAQKEFLDLILYKYDAS